MRRILLIFTLCLFFLITNAQTDSTRTSYELGNEIIAAIKNNNPQILISLCINPDEVSTIIDQSQLNEVDKNRFKTDFIDELYAFQKEINNLMTFRCKEIGKLINKNKCKANTSAENTLLDSKKLNHLPFEIGTLEIYYTCGKHRTIIEVPVVHTISGWWILNDILIKK